MISEQISQKDKAFGKLTADVSKQIWGQINTVLGNSVEDTHEKLGERKAMM